MYGRLLFASMAVANQRNSRNVAIVCRRSIITIPLAILLVLSSVYLLQYTAGAEKLIIPRWSNFIPRTSASRDIVRKRHLNSSRGTSVSDLNSWNGPEMWLDSIPGAPSSPRAPAASPDSLGDYTSPGLGPGPAGSRGRSSCRTTEITHNTLHGSQILNKVRDTKDRFFCCKLCTTNESCNAWSWCRGDGSGIGCLNSLRSGWAPRKDVPHENEGACLKTLSLMPAPRCS